MVLPQPPPKPGPRADPFSVNAAAFIRPGLVGGWVDGEYWAGGEVCIADCSEIFLLPLPFSAPPSSALKREEDI